MIRKSTKSNGLSDEARRLGVSRQRVWQLRNHAAGLCIACPQPRLDATHCTVHIRKRRELQRKSRAAAK